jgi:leucyl-tRNA synthetase
VQAAATLIRLIAPMAPHLAEEAWAAGGNPGLVSEASWPQVDAAQLVEDKVTVAIQVNGKLRDTVVTAKGTARDELERLALASEKIRRLLDGALPKKVVVVPDRLVNVVL